MGTAHVILTAIAIMGTAVIYGADIFAATVLRPALTHLDDHALGALSGFVHLYGDRRLVIPGIGGTVATGAATLVAIIQEKPGTIVLDSVALTALLAWLGIYLRINAPINRAMTEAALKGETLGAIRTLQRKWDSVAIPRATLQAVAVGCLFAATVAS
ncbi:DUF1772 domain-containing protein [Nocardia sp. R7R-8]|uniref:DUF1772 domain-containing protein n=1 Tax=Nocardia sp. R7R-8 TaxID=3459304 RepID=UPI00403E2888